MAMAIAIATIRKVEVALHKVHGFYIEGKGLHSKLHCHTNAILYYTTLYYTIVCDNIVLAIAKAIAIAIAIAIWPQPWP